MASRNINVLMSLQDTFSAPMRKIGQTTKETEQKIARAKNSIEKFGENANKAFFKAATGVAKFGAILAGAAISATVVGLKTIASESVTAAEKQLLAETQLESVLKNVTSIQERGAGATKKAADSLKAYAGELQQVGIIGDEVTLAGMAQLGTFQMNDDQIKAVSASMLDLLAKTKGYNATQEDAINVANMIGKAFTGNAGALSRVGITMTEAEKNAIKFGDANQRAAVIAKVLQSNVGGMNKAMAATSQGRQTQAMNAYGDMLEEFGKKLLPIKADLWGAFGEVLPQVQLALMQVFDLIAESFKELLPDIKAFIVAFAKALPGAIATVISGIRILIPIIKGLYNSFVQFLPVIAGVSAGFAAFNILKNVIAAFQALSIVINAARNGMLLFNLAMSLNPLGMIVIGIGLVVAAIVVLIKNWDTVKEVALNCWKSITDAFDRAIARMKEAWESFKSFIEHPIDTIVNFHQRKMAEAKHATGTSYFAGGLTRINEGGRGELINLPSGSQIIPNSLSRAALAGGGGQNINITLNVQGNVIGNEDFYNQCGRAITERLTAALGNM